MEFRIWDNQEKRWRKAIESDDYKYRYLFVGLNGLVNEIEICINSPLQIKHEDIGPIIEWQEKAKRYEVSQYIGRMDSKGVKAFTGDTIRAYSAILTAEANDRIGPTTIGEIVFHEDKYQVAAISGPYYDRGATATYLDIHPNFTIIGNKWEGIGKQEPVNLSGSSGDSTVQQQIANSIPDNLIDLDNAWLEFLSCIKKISEDLRNERINREYFAANDDERIYRDEANAKYNVLCSRCNGLGTQIAFCADIQPPRTMPCTLCKGTKVINRRKAI